MSTRIAGTLAAATEQLMTVWEAPTSLAPSGLTTPAPRTGEPGESGSGPIVRPREHSQSTFLVHVHRFRAIAILIIVAGHAMAVFRWREHPLLAGFLLDLFENGTVLFVFISGYLFQYLARPDAFRYGLFLRTKLLHVVLPYIVVSTPAVLHALVRYKLPSDYPQLKGTSLGYQALWLYLKGGAHLNYPLWFIPMITLYYVAAPLFMILVRYPRLQQMIVVLVPLSLLAHRPPFPNVDTVDLALYYLSAYVAGMYVSQRRYDLEPLIDAWLGGIGAVFGGLLLGYWWLSPYHGNSTVTHIFSFERGLIDWLFLQKLVLAVFLLGLMRRGGSRSLGVLDYLATVSFTVFFLHMYVLFLVRTATHTAPLEGNLGRWFALCVVTVAVSTAAAALGRRVLGRHSRVLIGAA